MARHYKCIKVAEKQLRFSVCTRMRKTKKIFIFILFSFFFFNACGNNIYAYRVYIKRIVFTQLCKTIQTTYRKYDYTNKIKNLLINLKKKKKYKII